jgi:hypothetical protein
MLSPVKCSKVELSPITDSCAYNLFHANRAPGRKIFLIGVLIQNQKYLSAYPFVGGSFLWQNAFDMPMLLIINVIVTIE